MDEVLDQVDELVLGVAALNVHLMCGQEPDLVLAGNGQLSEDLADLHPAVGHSHALLDLVIGEISQRCPLPSTVSGCPFP